MVEFSGVKAIVVDIEGTISSTAFVKQVLFPYAKQRLASFVSDNQVALTDIIQETRSIAGLVDGDIQAVITQLLAWIEADAKITPLKTLQGMIWKQGYEQGELKSDIYADALSALYDWHKQAVPLYVYSSGSVQAQKLFFAHTHAGDVRFLFKDYFDTQIGNKQQLASYQAIAEKINIASHAILFLSDHHNEVEAAAQARWQVAQIVRHDEQEYTGLTHRPWPVVGDFQQLSVVV